MLFLLAHVQNLYAAVFSLRPLSSVILSEAKNLTARPFAEFILSAVEGLRVIEVRGSRTNPGHELSSSAHHHTFPVRESLASPIKAGTVLRQPGSWFRKMLAAKRRLAPA